MNKLFSLLLVAALLIGLLAACGEQKAAPTGGESGEGSALSEFVCRTCPHGRGRLLG